MADLDLENESDADKAIDLLKQDCDAVEWWVLLMGTFASVLLDDLGAGESSALVVHAVRTQAAHSMLVFKERLEEHVWTGYKHTRLIYDIASPST